jgi:6-pyruvoyl-tetrahydropterin synthase
MVVNFRDVKRWVRERVVDALDHRHINDLMSEIPTAENIACWIAARLLEEKIGARLERLELWETRNSCALLEGEDLDSLRPR